MVDPAPVILCLTATAAPLAARLATSLEGVLHGRAGRVDAEVTFAETTAHVRELFAAGVPVIGLCAAGILIRAVAPLLADKRAEPPLLAVAEDGSAVVPLLGGHRGANRLAQRVAAVLGTAPAITTAGDVALGVALDDPPAGWRLETPEAAGSSAAALLSGKAGVLTGDAPFLAALKQHPNIDHHTLAPSDAAASLSVTDAPTLRYHRTELTLGVGCARHCPPEELAELVRTALQEAGFNAAALAGVFSLDLKADEAAVLDLAEDLGIPARFFSAATLEAQTPRLANPSEVVFAEVGCHGVAEAAALAAAGPAGRLVVQKRKSANATVAIALAPEPITQHPGRKRGQVSLVGIGPGQPAWRTPEASRLIVDAEELVGYGFYIDLLGPLAAGKPRADFPLGGEEDRCRYALEQAALGRNIAIICSGDAGIYAMGALVYELMARDETGISDAARRVEVVTAPGISALQAAAARIGAPLGHDFCAISLSDLLTPREDIERRIDAAAASDFVIAFYNPVSKRRKDLFVNAINTLLLHRPPSTPVLLARSLGRKDETLRLMTLACVNVEDVDMMTVVLVGSTQSRTVPVGGRARMFTPRGYARKHDRPES